MFRIESLVAIIRGFVDVGPWVFLSGDEVQNLKDPTQHTEKIALATSSRCPCLDTFAKSLFEWHEAAFFHVLLHGIEPARNEIRAESRQAILRMMAVATWHITLDYTVLGWGLAWREAQFFKIEGNSCRRINYYS